MNGYSFEVTLIGVQTSVILGIAASLQPLLVASGMSGWAAAFTAAMFLAAALRHAPKFPIKVVVVLRIPEKKKKKKKKKKRKAAPKGPRKGRRKS